MSPELINFLGINEPYLSNLINALDFLSFRKGDYFLQQGAYCRNIAIMTSGSARTFYIKESGEDVSFLLQYDYAFLTDYESVLLNQPAKVNIQFLEDATVYLFPTKLLNSLCETDFYWVSYTKKIMDTIYLEARSRIEDLLYLDAKQRYNKLLKKSPDIFQKIPQKYIASYLGIKPPSLSRIKKSIY
ncbi:Crp/Fnr family transcriptional regulator [Olivibacter ginsenosidimutans]|uniref:Crp/Fnr family transcriptional regulator n=1 Tax=Olivibacter ginsenosidimutans TaxID=1176537 RepID=A0ABP9BUT7_9SPHI